MKPLTKSQQKVFDYIVECSHEGRVPSVREVCSATGLKSTSTVHLHLKSLEEMGYIQREPGLNRCIKVVGEVSTSSVPVLGRVAAGNPIVAIEDVECYVPVPQDLCRGKEVFALRVQGESMINAGILPDDILMINGSTEPAIKAGLDIAICEGDENNYKITTKADLERFETYLNI